MDRRMKYVLVLIIGLANLSYSQQWNTLGGVPIPNSDNQKSGGSFGAQLILTNDHSELTKKWNVPSEGVNIDTSNTVRRNESISAFIVFTGCRETENGDCQLVVEYTVLQPDGKLYSQTPKMEVWYNKPKPDNGSLQLSVDYLKVIFEAGEQVGRYNLSAEVTDLISGEVLALKSSFTASD